MRAASFHGLMTLAHDEDTFKIRRADFQFLAITASQLAITLENLSLLEETRQAYCRLTKLQDETIELEKMATRGTMSAEIGHELNNFLGVVAGNIDLLQVHLEKQNYDRLGKYLNTVSETLGKIKTFTNNLMDLSPISSKKEILRFDQVIKEVVEYLRPQKQFAAVEISLPETIEPISVEADTTQIQQLLYNLFHNAADATLDCARRQISIDVNVHASIGKFQFAIRDSGVGFDPDSLSKAFQEKFTTKPTGHGFGLVVCKRIVDNHGGELQIESARGEGTCISITFPIAAEITETQPIPVS
jgi:signal transduction histidine kinase